MSSVQIIAERVNGLFGQRLSAARRVKRISQTALANRLGYSRVTIANLESGKQNVQLHQVFAIADALDISVKELIPDAASVYGNVQDSLADIFLEVSKSRLNELLGDSK